MMIMSPMAIVVTKTAEGVSFTCDSIDEALLIASKMGGGPSIAEPGFSLESGRERA